MGAKLFDDYNREERQHLRLPLPHQNIEGERNVDLTSLANWETKQTETLEVIKHRKYKQPSIQTIFQK